MSKIIESQKKGGRPTAYRDEYAPLAKRLCLLGFTDRQLGQALDVSEQTVNAWKKAHPDFAEALRQGKAAADADVVEALFHKALGGDTTACIFWLKNRQPLTWKDRKQHEVGPTSPEGPQALEIRFVNADHGKPAPPEPQKRLE